MWANGSDGAMKIISVVHSIRTRVERGVFTIRRICSREVLLIYNFVSRVMFSINN